MVIRLNPAADQTYIASLHQDNQPSTALNVRLRQRYDLCYLSHMMSISHHREKHRLAPKGQDIAKSCTTHQEVSQSNKTRLD